MDDEKGHASQKHKRSREYWRKDNEAKNLGDVVTSTSSTSSLYTSTHHFFFGRVKTGYSAQSKLYSVGLDLSDPLKTPGT